MTDIPSLALWPASNGYKKRFRLRGIQNQPDHKSISIIDMSNSDLPPGEVPKEDDYVSRTGQKQSNVPVISDDQIGGIENNPSREQADSDAQLERDDNEAIDKSNILNERTRGGKPATGSMAEPGDEESMPPAEDGTSSGRQ